MHVEVLFLFSFFHLNTNWTSYDFFLNSGIVLKKSFTKLSCSLQEIVNLFNVNKFKYCLATDAKNPNQIVSITGGEC